MFGVIMTTMYVMHLFLGSHCSVHQFKELNSQLNREVAQFERAKAQGAHYLVDPGEQYEPSPSELEVDDTVHILGGVPDIGQAPLDETAEQRRQRILNATLQRLQKEEEQLEDSCGTAGKSSEPPA
jgi:hypothetical protein